MNLASPASRFHAIAMRCAAGDRVCLATPQYSTPA